MGINGRDASTSENYWADRLGFAGLARLDDKVKNAPRYAADKADQKRGTNPLPNLQKFSFGHGELLHAIHPCLRLSRRSPLRV